MSCGNPAAEQDALMPREKKYDKTGLCVRCKVSPGKVVIRHAVYCKDCFFPLITFKFRRALEPSVNSKPGGPRHTALKPVGNLLAGFSGGLGSTVLLDLIHRCYVSMDESTIPAEGGKNHPRHERVWKKVTVCYVEIADAFLGMRDKTADIAKLVERHEGIDFVPLRLQDAFDHRWWEKVGGRPSSVHLNIDITQEELFTSPSSLSSSPTPLNALRTYLASLPTSTAIPTTIQTLIRLLLLHTALETASSHLVLGTSLTSLAVSLISGVSQGRGFNVKEEIQEEWVPEEVISEIDMTEEGADSAPSGRSRERQRKKMRYVRVIRPLRDVGRKECAMWAWWAGLNVMGKEKLPWSGSRQDISSLTKDFITGLEKDYPSTVSTIVRTCTKLAPKGEVAGHCVLCARPIQEGVQEWKSRISIRARSPTSHTTDTPSNSETIAGLMAHLCYACHTTLTSKSSRPPPPLDPTIAKSSSVALPVWVGPLVCGRDEVIRSSRMSEEDKRSAVQEFLLDE